MQRAAWQRVRKSPTGVLTVTRQPWYPAAALPEKQTATVSRSEDGPPCRSVRNDPANGGGRGFGRCPGLPCPWRYGGPATRGRPAAAGPAARHPPADTG